MRAIRCRFHGALYEIRTACHDGAATAQIYVVQELSTALQPYGAAIAAPTEAAAQAEAIRDLERRFGKHLGEPRTVGEEEEYRRLGPQRSA